MSLADRLLRPPRVRGALGAADFGAVFGYPVKTLESYTTPYFYADGPAPLGRLHHFQSMRQLKNYVARMIRAGKVRDRSR